MRTLESRANVSALRAVVRDASVLIDGRGERILVRHDLTVLQFDALRVLSDGAGERMSLLARRLLCDDSTLTRAVGHLVTAGWIERGVDPADRRVTVARVTAAGRAHFGRAAAALEQDLAAIVGSLSSDDVAHLEQLMGQLVARLADAENSA